MRVGVSVVLLLVASMASGCSSGDGGAPADIEVVRYVADAAPTAIVSGSLRIEEGCSYLDAPNGDTYALIWPSSSDFTEHDDGAGRLTLGDETIEVPAADFTAAGAIADRAGIPTTNLTGPVEECLTTESVFFMGPIPTTGIRLTDRALECPLGPDGKPAIEQLSVQRTEVTSAEDPFEAAAQIIDRVRRPGQDEGDDSLPMPAARLEQVRSEEDAIARLDGTSIDDFLALDREGTSVFEVRGGRLAGKVPLQRLVNQRYYATDISYC